VGGANEHPATVSAAAPQTAMSDPQKKVGMGTSGEWGIGES
jgi:hypothetical protein